MTKKLEDLLNLPPKDLELGDDTLVTDITVDCEQALEDAAGIMTALSHSEKVDIALTSVTGLLEHDREMDDIAEKALHSYKELCDLGQNVADLHTGKIFEVAATMLKTAMDAKDAKVSKKLKMIDLQMKKLKLDKDISPVSDPTDTNEGVEFDRNELLKHIVDNVNSANTDK